MRIRRLIGALVGALAELAFLAIFAVGVLTLFILVTG